MYNKQKQVNILHSKILSIHTYTFVMAQQKIVAWAVIQNEFS